MLLVFVFGIIQRRDSVGGAVHFAGAEISCISRGMDYIYYELKVALLFSQTRLHKFMHFI